MAITQWIVVADGTNVRYHYERKEEVSAQNLCDRFNGGDYWYRAEINGEYELACEYNELAPPEVNQPPGTLSQIIIYHNAPDFVVRVHQYLLPDEERDEHGQLLLGGSGMPDPKELLEEDRVLRVLRPRRRPSF